MHSVNACVCVQSRLTLCDPVAVMPARILCPWNFLGKSTGIGSHFFLHRIFPTPDSNAHALRLLHWYMDSLPQSHLGSPYSINVHCQIEFHF